MSRMVFIDDDSQDNWQSGGVSADDADDATDVVGADDDSDADADDADEAGDAVGGDSEDENW